VRHPHHGASPLFWLQSGLALTDMFGMVFVVGFLLVEGATTTAPRGALAKRIACGLIAGLSLGARPHITLLIVVYWCLRATWSRPIEVGHVLTAVLAFAVGIAAWLIPASIATGGPEIYWSARVRPARVLLHTRPLLRPGDGKPPADPVRDCGFTCRPGRLDHDIRSYELIARVFDGQPEGLTRDDILGNITLYWLTNTAVSSARLYWENKLAFFAPKNVSIPVAVSAFPDDIYAAPRTWVERAYPKLIHYNKLPKGGHFAAWEQPQFFSEEVRAGFRPLRK